MKTTLELPDKLMRAVKIRAAETDRKLKDVIAELIERGLKSGTPADPGEDPLQEWASKLVYKPDGSVSNPDGIEDKEFFETLDEIRESSRQRPGRDPFADLD